MTRIRYMQGPGRWGQLISQHNSDTGQSRYYGFDPMGNTRFLADSSGTITDTYSYKAFGEPVTSSGSTPNPLRYGGKVGYYRDKIERVYIRARHYEPQTGRWMSHDPIGFDECDWNLYRYVGNDPVDAVDPSGMARRKHHPCIDRARVYCDAARERNWQDRAPNGFCYVSSHLCTFIMANRLYPPETRRHLDCLSRCMFRHWSRKDTPLWRAADKICQKCGEKSQYSQQCCEAKITAEQNGFTRCDKICRGKYKHGNLRIPTSFPFNGNEAQRIKEGIAVTCNGYAGDKYLAIHSEDDLYDEP